MPSQFHVHLFGADDSDANSHSPLAISFETAQQRLEELPKLYFEPDGSFVWSGIDHQVFGMLYDAAGRLQYVELRGRCSQSVWRSLVTCFTRVERTEVENSESKKPAFPADFRVMVLPERQWQNLQSFEAMFAN